MKKILSFSFILVLCVGVFAQSVTLTFTGRDANEQWIQLNRVVITNLTKGWQETIYWPDTILTMQNGTGIDDYANNGGFGLMQNNPNPFNGTTDVLLAVADAGAVTLEITDVNGRIVEMQNFASLQVGINTFRVTLSAAGTYILTARQNGKTSSVKMVNNGGGNGDGIEYVGIVETMCTSSLQPKSLIRGNTTNPFTFGDNLSFVGYVVLNGTEDESYHIVQTIDSSQTIMLHFFIGVPLVTTSEITDITGTSAVCGGTIISNGVDVLSRGVCWDTLPNPVQSIFSGSHFTTDGSGDGEFTSNITGLTEQTTYYVRAYARNSSGVGYGEERTFTTTYSVPTVTTSVVSDITDSSAICGGNVMYDGGAEVTARGVCWSTSPNPTIEDNYTMDGSGTGSFTSSLTGLTGSTQYYVRAYATNNVGTGYGNELNFVTKAQPCPETPTVTDICGNTYNTVQIGAQCWMKENLRTTRYSDNTFISEYCENGSFSSPNSNSSNIPDYGLLYSWEAVMHGASSSYANPSGVQGVCPQGWHVPSNSEWSQLWAYVRSQSQFFCNDDSSNIAKALADSIGWRNTSVTCAVGNILSDNNGTGFGARPAGSYSSYHFECYDFRSAAYFWTCSNGCHCSILYNHVDLSGLSNYNMHEQPGYSVRCLRNEGGIPTVTTAVASDITSTTSVCGGNVTNGGGTTVTARGVCWDTLPNPTVSSSHTIDGSGTGIFTSNLTELTPGIRYYVKAYATNSLGTAYGEEKRFYTQNPACPGMQTVIDVDGNTYNTVQIGQQCWMKENLRTTRYADSTEIPAGNAYSYTDPYRYAPNNYEGNVPTYGYLYNWAAVMHGSSSSSRNPSGVQGICPTGWHVPSDAEWTQLTDYVSSQSQYVCGGDNTYIAKALAGTTGWDSSTTTCAVGNTPSNNNATGFGALPAGYYGRGYYAFGVQACFGSATEYSSSTVYNRGLYCGYADVGRVNLDKSVGFSVRCLRD